MRRSSMVVALAIIVPLLLPALGRSGAEPGVARAGVGIADATWHVGAGSGQYTDKGAPIANVATGGDVDPHKLSTIQVPSYGVQSRLTYRALVVEGANGERVALVKSDAYLAQDMLARRVGQILAEGDSGITYEQILLQASHNHNSPYYMTLSWGPWLFQDVFEIRAFEYHARQIAAAIDEAADNLVPVRMGATVVEHSIYKGQIAGATITDDGTPGGYPESHADFGLTVMRFDDISGPRPKPLAAWVNFGQHPESLDGYDLISADFLAPTERFVERDIGAPLIYAQGDVGSAEGPYFRNNYEVLPDGVVRAWAHVGHAQTERGARYLADSIVEAWHQIDSDDARVPFSSDFPVRAIDGWIPGPVSHPYPAISNCRSETTAEGDPGVVVTGLPDCGRVSSYEDDFNEATGLESDVFPLDIDQMAWESLKAFGVPLPEHYDAFSFVGLQENMRLHLQTIRMGEVVLMSCSCEAQMDLVLNTESRADNVEGNIFDGYDWSWGCSQNPDTTWTCTHPRETTFSNARYERMQAQIHNDAKGWDAPENALAAQTEPSDPEQIWGNFTKEELPQELGYALPVMIGTAGDYLGYVVSYREFMSRDHYRKALTAFGPHTADYMATRLVRFAGALKDGPQPAAELLDPAAQADEARQVAMAAAVGQLSSATYEAWRAALPSDVGPAEVLEQPSDVTRFDAATFSWRGGSNAVDNPVVRVERLVEGEWIPYADQSGEVQTKVEFPQGMNAMLDTYTGNQSWTWTANFEAFDAFPRAVHPDGQTPNGHYRFVVDGTIRLDGADQPYHLESEFFQVHPWGGITVDDIQVDGAGDVSFVVPDIVYPRTYDSAFRFVADDGNQVLCRTCSFRPWARVGEVASARVTVVRADSTEETVDASLVAGRWVAPTALSPGDQATIAIGGVRDTYGEVNGVAYPVT